MGNRSQGKRAIQKMAERFKIIADAEWQGGSEMRAASRDIDQLDDNVNSSSLRFTEFASAMSIAQQGLQVVGEAARFAYENISEGAALNLARDQFDSLSESIGTTSDSLLNNLRNATKGMISDAELVAGATELIALGLAKDEETAVRLGAAVGALNLDMQVLGLTLANNSTARLDSLKLSMEDVIATQRELEAQGFAGDAFDQAVLIELEKNMELFGDASEETAGQLQKLEADWDNLTDSWKQGAAELSGPVVSAMVDNRDKVDILRQAYDKGLITQMEFIRAQQDATVAGQEITEVIDKYNLVLDENNEIIGSVVDGNIKLTQQAEKYAEVVESTFEPTNRMSDATEVLSDKQLQLANQMTESEASIANANRAMEEARIANAELAGGLDNTADAADRAGGLIGEIQSRLDALGSRRDFLFNISVAGLEGLQRAIGIASGFNANDQPDPFAPQGDRNFGDEFVQTGEGGSTIVQNNTFVNPTNPEATATATAEKLGNLK